MLKPIKTSTPPSPLKGGQAKTLSLHGVLMCIADIGVLITGSSGIGKSEAALGLIERGEQLIADDAPLFVSENDQLIGRCSPVLQNKLHVHGLGVLDITHLYGAQAICQQIPLELIISLSEQPQPKSLEACQTSREVMSVKIPERVIPVSQGRNCALLIHCAVRAYLKTKKGYNAALNSKQV